MNKILILFAHPRFEKSRVHKALVKAIPPWITFVDLYELYPDFVIDTPKEKSILLEHDIIIWQHPFYWYSVPPLLKQWIDVVLEYGWAYGPGGVALKDKIVFNAISAGGPESVYKRDARNRFTVNEFLAPLDQTARLCLMKYLPPFMIHGTHLLTESEIATNAMAYQQLLEKLQHADLNKLNTDGMKYLNELNF